MNNLIKAIKREEKKRASETIQALNSKGLTIESILDKWYYRELIPQSSKRKKWANVTELKNYLKNRVRLQRDKRISKEIERVQTVFNTTRKIEQINISVTWAKSRTWGKNPTAEARVLFNDNTAFTFRGHTASGCGYDKESQTIASALNQCNELLKMMYKVKNRDTKSSNHKLLGYGSGYGILPSFEGGVGVSSHRGIFEKLKFNFESVAHGKNFDVYTVTK